jgi:hypothetical protein
MAEKEANPNQHKGFPFPDRGRLAGANVPFDGRGDGLPMMTLMVSQRL